MYKVGKTRRCRPCQLHHTPTFLVQIVFRVPVVFSLVAFDELLDFFVKPVPEVVKVLVFQKLGCSSPLRRVDLETGFGEGNGIGAFQELQLFVEGHRAIGEG